MTIGLRDLVRTDTNRTGHVIALSVVHQMARVQFVNTVEDAWIALALLEQVNPTHADDERYAGLRDLLPRRAVPSWVSQSSHGTAPARCA